LTLQSGWALTIRDSTETEKETEMDATSRRVTNALKTAIRREERTAKAYQVKARKMKDPTAKKALESLSKIELGHARKLTNVLEKGTDLGTLGKKGKQLAEDLHVLNDDIREIEQSSEAVKVLSRAAKAEENSRRLYRSLQNIYKGLDIADFFGKMAEEEEKHKERLEKLLARL
jgi:rubrerythrin